MAARDGGAFRSSPSLAAALACAWACSFTSGIACKSTARQAPGDAASTPPPDAAPPAPSGGVLQHHNASSRNGVYVDPLMTRTAAAAMHLDPAFAATGLAGTIFANLLYLNGAGATPDVLIVATFTNHVYALNAANGQVVWDRLLAPPGVRPTTICSPGPVGITGTPVIDGATRTIYVDAMTSVGSTDAGSVNKHYVFALDADTGNTRPGGWPVDVNAWVRVGAVTFDSSVQNQRGALMLVGGTLFIPYGGFGGDCGMYHGWIVGISIADPTRVTAWVVPADGGAGVWAPGGMSSDGTSIYFGTGNGGSKAAGWHGTEAIFRVPTSLAPSDNPKDYFTPANWMELDGQDADLGGTAPILVDAPGVTPSALVLAFGKDRMSYLLDRNNLGGVGGALSSMLATLDPGFITAPAAYTTPLGTYVVLADRAGNKICPNGSDGFVTSFKIQATSPPTLGAAWCKLGLPKQPITVPAVSMTDAQGSNAIVWVAGTDDKLYALDGDTGTPLLNGSADLIPNVERFQGPVIAKGRLFVANKTGVYAFTSQ
jgi:outer membrane protein assembly factor BamB